MSSLFLVPENFPQLSAMLASGRWVVACLCAGWCDVYKQYREGFDALAEQYPQHHFVWIDIEDQADLVGDLVREEGGKTHMVASFGFVEFED